MTNPSPTNENAMTLEQAFEHGISLYQHQKKKEAREVFEQILSHAPDAVPVLQVLAVLDAEDGLWQAAINKLDKALAVEPGNASLLFDKAGVLTQFGLNKEALEIIDSLLAVAPTHQELLAMRQQVTAPPANWAKVAAPQNTKRPPKPIKTAHLVVKFRKPSNLPSKWWHQTTQNKPSSFSKP
ncbi:tetratricopeptide repeat protein [Enterovibrio coralii]|uniref:tetratricopeptide repeat protein n=1 Tax=Enterovibrio coralii TaxID=294935 RepID=UPI000A526886|nr:tetratricopeptide repeat protein [Enterovibrio coralii]